MSAQDPYHRSLISCLLCPLRINGQNIPHWRVIYHQPPKDYIDNNKRDDRNPFFFLDQQFNGVAYACLHPANDYLPVSRERDFLYLKPAPLNWDKNPSTVCLRSLIINVDLYLQSLLPITLRLSLIYIPSPLNAVFNLINIFQLQPTVRFFHTNEMLSLLSSHRIDCQQFSAHNQTARRLTRDSMFASSTVRRGNSTIKGLTINVNKHCIQNNGPFINLRATVNTFTCAA